MPNELFDSEPIGGILDQLALAQLSGLSRRIEQHCRVRPCFSSPPRALEYSHDNRFPILGRPPADHTSVQQYPTVRLDELLQTRRVRLNVEAFEDWLVLFDPVPS